MASRDLAAAQLAMITAAAKRPVLFFEGEFSGGTLRLWSGVGTISWNSMRPKLSCHTALPICCRTRVSIRPGWRCCTTASARIGNFGQRLPSIIASFGCICSPATARCIANMVACRMVS
jgi:hypothetical protein